MTDKQAEAKAEHDAKAAEAKAEQEAKAAEAEAAKAKAEYEAMSEPDRLRADLVKVDALPEDALHPDSKSKQRQAILERLRELYEPVVPAGGPLTPAPAAKAQAETAPTKT